MLAPIGPLPPSVYWRRRVIVASVALVAVLVLWLVAGAGGGDSRAAGPSGSTVNSVSDGLTPTASASLAATPPAVDPGRPADGGSATATASAATPTPPAPPSACTDRALKLTVATEAASYRVGTTPVVVLTVRNVGGVICTRDLGVAQQEVLLYHGTTRLWSSNDCYPGGEKDVRALAPGEQDRFAVTWSGLTSRPRCAGARVRVQYGHYALVARVGTLRSARAPLVLR